MKMTEKEKRYWNEEHEKEFAKYMEWENRPEIKEIRKLRTDLEDARSEVWELRSQVSRLRAKLKQYGPLEPLDF